VNAVLGGSKLRSLIVRLCIEVVDALLRDDTLIHSEVKTLLLYPSFLELRNWGGNMSKQLA